jgi:hypothetical protein
LKKEERNELGGFGDFDEGGEDGRSFGVAPVFTAEVGRAARGRDGVGGEKFLEFRGREVAFAAGVGFAFRAAIGGEEETAAGFEHAEHFGDGKLDGGDVLDNGNAGEEVEGGVGERDVGEVDGAPYGGGGGVFDGGTPSKIGGFAGFARCEAETAQETFAEAGAVEVGDDDARGEPGEPNAEEGVEGAGFEDGEIAGDSGKMGENLIKLPVALAEGKGVGGADFFANEAVVFGEERAAGGIAFGGGEEEHGEGEAREEQIFGDCGGRIFI